MCEALDLVEQFFEKAQSDGSLFLDPALDIFHAPIAAKQQLFADWRKYTFEKDTRLSPDGSKPHLLYKLARDELLQPTDATKIRTRAKTIEYLEVQCAAALRKMHDPKLALADKLTSQDGANSIGKQAQAHADTQGCSASNDALAESAVRSKILAFGDSVMRRKKSKEGEEPQQEPAYLGWFHGLPPHEQEALVELARLTVAEMRDIDRADHAELDQYHKARRKANEANELDALFTRYALALSFFERWQKRGVESFGQRLQPRSGARGH
eukprot:2622040-Prymnesium_polylepis.1